MSILFFGNKTGDFTDDHMSSENDTLLGDQDYVALPISYMMTSSGNAQFADIQFDGAVNLDDEVWFHFRVGVDALTNPSAGTGTQIEFYDAAGNVVFELCTVSRAISIRAVGDTTVTTSHTALVANSDSKRVIDIMMKVSAADITATLYVDSVVGTEVTATAANTVGNKGPVVFAKITMLEWIGGSYSHEIGISEFIVTNGENTIGWRLAGLEPDGPGQYTQMLGSYEDVIKCKRDFNFLSAAESGIRESWTVGDYNGATVGYEIRAVGMKFRAQQGVGSGPQSMQHMVVIDGSPYESAEVPLQPMKTLHSHIWEVNPATGNPWDFTELADLEFGVRSGA